MDHLAVQQVKLKESIRSLTRLLEKIPSTNRKASHELRAKLSRLQSRISQSQAGYSREAAKKVLVVVAREVAELALKLVIEAFIRSESESWHHHAKGLAMRFDAFARRAA